MSLLTIIISTNFHQTLQIKYKKNISTINNCNLIIGENNSWKHVNMNPQAPDIHGTIKLHKDNLPIRPTVNWKNSPGYKLAQLVSSTLSTTLQLPYTFNINNTLSLMQSLNNIEINSNTKLCSFDITNMYTNIPTTELTTIIKEILKTIKSQNIKTNY
jgi:hypothetical protein